jgi:hypothetical protein
MTPKPRPFALFCGVALILTLNASIDMRQTEGSGCRPC